jgi:hypothetical protein
MNETIDVTRQNKTYSTKAFLLAEYRQDSRNTCQLYLFYVRKQNIGVAAPTSMKLINYYQCYVTSPSRKIPHNSFIPQTVLRKVHSLFQSKFSTQYELLLPLAIYSILFFSLRSSSSRLRLLPRLPVIYILPSTVPSKTCLEGSSYAKCGQSG